MLLSLPAALLAVLSSVSLLGPGLAAELEEAVFEVVDRTFTAEADGVRNAISGLFDQPRAGLFSAALAAAVFTLSGGFSGLIRALDVAYDVEESRNFLRVRLTGLVLAVGTLALIAASTYAWAWTERNGIPNVVRFPSALLLFVLWAATIFHIGPHHRTPWRYDIPGAVLTAVGWLLLSVGFGWYVRIAGSGNELVGATGAALLALTFVWLACVVLLIGAELNEIIASRAGVVQAPAPLVPPEWAERVRDEVRRRRATSGPDDVSP